MPLKEDSKARIKSSMVDTHAHLDMNPFRQDRTEVISQARDSGVSTIITVGLNLKSSQQAVNLAEKHTEVLATAGFHPHEASQVSEADIATLAKIADHPRVVAIGETGLDFHRNYAPREAQLQVLKWQLEVAAKMELPVIIHCREAEPDLLTVLRDWASSHQAPPGKPIGVIHCFNSDADTARQYLDMGFFISLGAYIGYPASTGMYDTIRSIPQDRLVVETDCPYLPPQSHRGQRNEPAYLPFTIRTLAEIREVPPETVARETTRNAHRLFRITRG